MRPIFRALPRATVTTRAARTADLPALIRLLGQLFAIESDFRPDRAKQRRGLAALLADRRARVLVAVASAARRGQAGGTARGQVLGMVTAQLVTSTAEGAPSAWVEDMVVDEAARGAGVGALLLAGIEAWAVGRGATRVQLLADKENGGALRFYAREGWEETALVCRRKLSARRTPSRRRP